MSRERNKYIVGRNSLPAVIRDLEIDNESNENVVFYKKPQFLGLPKEFINNPSKPIFFHERAQLINKIDKKNIGFYENTEQIIDFEKFMYLFKNEEEINNLELQDLLDTDFEKLSELKAKAEEFTDATSTLMEEKIKLNPALLLNNENTPENELMNFFMDKLNEMKENEINLKIFIDNLERVKGMSYSNNGVKVYYKKNQ